MGDFKHPLRNGRFGSSHLDTNDNIDLIIRAMQSDVAARFRRISAMVFHKCEYSLRAISRHGSSQSIHHSPAFDSQRRCHSVAAMQAARASLS